MGGEGGLIFLRVRGLRSMGALEGVSVAMVFFLEVGLR